MKGYDKLIYLAKKALEINPDNLYVNDKLFYYYVI